MHHWSSYPGQHAAQHLRHFLENTGTNYRIDLDGLVSGVPSAAALFESSLHDAKVFARVRSESGHTELLPNVRNRGPLRRARARTGSSLSASTTLGAKAVVSVIASNTSKRISMDYEYKFFDLYNWDKGKAVRIFGMAITDAEMGETAPSRLGSRLQSIRYHQTPSGHLM
jgi:hypothetical protein